MPRRPLRVRLLAPALLVQAVCLPAELLAMALSRAPYDPLAQTISDLAATTCTRIAYPSGPVAVCSPGHAVLNASWVVAGAALLLAAWGLAGMPTAAAGRWGRRAALALLAVMGVSTVACGLVPLDVHLEAHALVSLPAILLGPAAAGAALALWWPGGAGRAGWAVAVPATLAALAMLMTLDGFGVTGLLERIAVWVPLLALAVLGVRLGRPGTTKALRGAAAP